LGRIIQYRDVSAGNGVEPYQAFIGTPAGPLPHHEMATATQWAIKINQIRPLTTSNTVTEIINFCSKSIFSPDRQIVNANGKNALMI